MTWLDVALLIFLALFLAVGARLGSLWTASCLAGGFVGAFLADMYSLSFASYIKAVPGSAFLAGAILFVVGAAMIMVPGIALSSLFEGVFLGVIDSAFGLFTGAMAGILAVTAFLLVAVPAAPKIETLKAWKKSAVVKPLHHSLEQMFQSPRFRRNLSGLGAARIAISELKPLSEKAGEKIKDVAEKAVDRVKG